MRFFHAGLYNQRSKHVHPLQLLTEDICFQIARECWTKCVSTCRHIYEGII